MKYCLSSKQEKEQLNMADEIKIKWKDREQFYDLINDFSNKTIILEVEANVEIDWNKIIEKKIISKDKLILCLYDLSIADKCKENSIPFYYAYPVNSFFELKGLKELGVCYIKIAPPLTHSLNKVFDFKIPIRYVPNIAYQSYIKMRNGVCGQWIRPEDIEAYEKYISVIEFEDCSLKKEKALYKIYAEDKEWKGNLDTLITNLNYNADNSLIDSNSILKRMTCEQSCQKNNVCKLCYRVLNLANASKLKDYLRGKKNESNE